MALSRRFTFASALVVLAAVTALAAPQGQTVHRFAQSLVDQMHSAHPEFLEIGISAVVPGKGCYGLASTDKSDIGSPCESGDVAPLKTGKALVGNEGKNLDISLPLHDAAGHVVGIIGIEAAPGAGRAAVLLKVRAAVREMEGRIPSKDKLIS